MHKQSIVASKRPSRVREGGRGRAARPLLVSTLALALAACTVGPDFVRPTPSMPEQFTRVAAGEPLSGTVPADAEFWQRFDDPVLTDLVEETLLANHDLRIALANYDRANALLREAGFERFPTVTAGAEAADSRASADQRPGAGRDARDSESYSASANLGWELDLFGRIRRSVEASRASAAASAADLHALQVAIVGEVATTYVELRGLQEQLRVARENAGNQHETLALVEARLQAGAAGEFDTSRARAQLQGTLAQLPALEARIAVDMHRLAVLTGKTPGMLVDRLQYARELPALPAPVAVGAPGELLRRRPDIAAAEARLHASTARIGVATADLFPRFTLGGLIGSQAIEADDLFTRDSETRLVALGIDWSFLDVGRVRARIAAADADAAAELARYQQAVLLALEDAENALVRLDRAREADAHLREAAEASARAAELARIRYDAGATGLLEVLDAERVRLEAQDAFAEGRTRAVNRAIEVYLALAGGWPERMPVREDIARAE